MQSLEIRHLTPDEVAGAEQAFALLFGEPQNEDRNRAETDPLDPQRCVAAFDAGRIVGHVGVIPLAISVPGGRADLCAITLVFVDTTHRRQGLGKTMMVKALTEASEPVAALWASRPGFYERLGFEPAVASAIRTITSDDVVPLRSSAPQPERVVRADEAIQRRDMPIVFDQAMAFRPGMTARSEAWWGHRFIGDAQWRRYGGDALQHVVAYRDEKPVAYAIYNLIPKQDQKGPNHEMIIHECVAINSYEEAAMMGWLCQVDLVGKINAHWRPMDDGFVQTLVQRRTIHDQVTDALYIRILNVADAIAKRSYFATGSVTIRITDDLIADNAGLWAVTFGPEGGQATRLPEDTPADLTMDIRALAGLWLGGHSLNAFIGAGLVTIHNPEVSLLVHQAFQSPVSPWSPEVW